MFGWGGQEKDCGCFLGVQKPAPTCACFRSPLLVTHFLARGAWVPGYLESRNLKFHLGPGTFAPSADFQDSGLKRQGDGWGTTRFVGRGST